MRPDLAISLVSPHSLPNTSQIRPCTSSSSGQSDRTLGGQTNETAITLSASTIRVYPSQADSKAKCFADLLSWAKITSDSPHIGAIKLAVNSTGPLADSRSNKPTIDPTYAVATSADGKHAFILRFQPLQGIFGEITLSADILDLYRGGDNDLDHIERRTEETVIYFDVDQFGQGSGYFVKKLSESMAATGPPLLQKIIADEMTALSGTHDGGSIEKVFTEIKAGLDQGGANPFNVQT